MTAQRTLHEAFPRLKSTIYADLFCYCAGAVIIAIGTAFTISALSRAPYALDSSAKKLTLNTPTAIDDKSLVLKTYRLRDVAQWDFFGIPSVSEVTVDVKSLPETTLNLKLIGTFTSNIDSASAVVGTEQKATRRVFLGGAISDGVTLHSVHEYEIIINRGSVLETLTMYEPVEHASSRPQRKTRSSASRQLTGESVAQQRSFQETAESMLAKMKKLRAALDSKNNG